jgi:hypothetical protein
VLCTLECQQTALVALVVIPAHAGIQAAPRIWIPACAGMTFHLYMYTPGRAFNVHNTL